MKRTFQTLVFSVGLIACCHSLAAGADRWQTLVDAGNAAIRKRDYVSAKKLFDQALKDAQRAGLDDPRVGKTSKLLGDLYFEQKKYDEAKAYYSRSQILEDVSRYIVYSEAGLVRGDFLRVKEYAQLSLTQLESTVGDQDAALTPVLILLAKAEKGLKQESVEVETLNRAIKILEFSAAGSREMASALDLLGQVLDDQNKSADAEPLLKRGLDIRQKILDTDDSQLEESFDHLAVHYRRLGNEAAAGVFQKLADGVQEKELVNLVDYVDKDNGFRLRIPASWSDSPAGLSPKSSETLLQAHSPDLKCAVVVERIQNPPGLDSSDIEYDGLGVALSAAYAGTDLGEENVLLSGLPARRIWFTTARGGVRLQHWRTLLLTRNQLWSLQLFGPEAAMKSPDGPLPRAAQMINESFLFLDPVLQGVKSRSVVPLPLQTITGDSTHCRRYENRDVAMRVLLPDGWGYSGQALTSSGAHSIAMLNRAGTPAIVILSRETLNVAPDDYTKLLLVRLQKSSEGFQVTSTSKVSFEGGAGMQMGIDTRESGIDYRCVQEVFSIGNEQYSLLARAPAEVFARYKSAFDDILQSVEFIPVAARPPANSPEPVQMLSVSKP